MAHLCKGLGLFCVAKRMQALNGRYGMYSKERLNTGVVGQGSLGAAESEGKDFTAILLLFEGKSPGKLPH